MKTKPISSRLILSAVAIGIVATLPGCAGTSQDDMRKYAIRRTPDPEEDESDEPAAIRPTAAKIATESEQATSTALATKPEINSVNAGSSVASPTKANQHPPEVAPDSSATLADNLTKAANADESLSATERKKQTAEKLQTIAKAWQTYISKKRTFPWRTQNVSWRVQLLPYLGYDSLYEKFELDEPWDSTANIGLVEQIPPIYQSVDRTDFNTNFLAIDGPQTLFEPVRPLSPGQVEDGANNTIAIVEADDNFAVPWTQPNDLQIQYSEPLIGLGALHKDGFFAVWADGQVGWIDIGVKSAELAKAFSTNSTDGFSSEAISYPAEIAWLGGADRPQPAMSNVTTGRSDSDDNGTVNRATLAQESLPKTQTVYEIAAVQAMKREEERLSGSLTAVPKGSELKEARDLIKELFGSRYAGAKTNSKRIELAREMLDALPRIAEDIPGQYALLDIARQIAIHTGDVDIALEATDRLTSRFAVRSTVLLETFEQLVRIADSDQGKLKNILAKAEQAFDRFVRKEQYDQAERLSQLATSAASKINDEDSIDVFTSRRQWAAEANRLSQAAAEALKMIEDDPNHERANGDIGKFACLIKGDWENGLVILANGNDRSLKRLAELEIARPTEAVAQLELADLWWKEADAESPAFKSTLQSRAKHWYEQALPGLPAGLVRIRVERRIEELDKQAA